MEAVLFSGIQAAGKSSFFTARFADSHVRLNLDMLRTRHRERLLLAACLAARQAFVVDNTNLTAADRRRYIEAARAAGFRIVGYRFRIELAHAIARNAGRARPVPEVALRAARSRWQVPAYAEGFDALYDVRAEDGRFVVVPVAPDAVL
ncbi:ATP-binding protein [Parasulfuritortus cantonensis]|uniref:ATP-binding protein n=1 Tax=Parasulfuritortus cantonensis TaxID=2528202 RepID=A0A4R1B7F2_9PROT|nr:AAA family ATPase [Parasulfuritortus cantonensis]TCJ11703.1 ATP-binding protein [Parasulfuritortus cantonensis]